MLKILLIAGHGAGDPGACSSYGIEADETRKVVAKMLEEFKNYKNAEVTLYPTNRNAYADVKNGTTQVNFSNFDYAFEVHFNSATSANATGTEIFVTTSENVINVEEKVVKKIADTLNITNRGVKKSDFAVIENVKNKGTSSALLELCFISNKIDMEKYNLKFNNVCNSIVQAICEGFSLTRTVLEGKWVKDSKGWWYQKSDGTYPKNIWQLINGEWYFFGADGYAYVERWIQWKGKWYWLNKDCKMVKECVLTINNKYYAFGQDGVMKEKVEVRENGELIL